VGKLKVAGIFGITSLLIDQVSKWIVIRYIPFHQSIPVVDDVIRLTHVRNPMAAWGIPISGTPALIILPVAIVIVVIIYTLRARSFLEKVALAIVLGGAAGNFVDRVRWRYVIDFIDIGAGGVRWPVFNLADAFITIGMILIFYAALKKRG
jgi:signal peptidase II